MVSFEDLWPHDGDLDFNDLISAYNYTFVLDTSGNIIGLQGAFDVLALGASLHNGLYLHLPVSAAMIGSAQLATGGANTPASISPLATLGSASLTDAVFTLVADPRTLFINQGGYINTEPSQAALTGEAPTLSVLFTAPLDPSDFDIGKAPFDLFLARVGDESHQTHLSQFDGSATGADASLFHTGDDASNQDRTATGGANNTGRYFCNANGIPFGLAYPQLAEWAAEKVSIENAFPAINAFASSGGTADTDFYLYPNDTYTWQAQLTAGSPPALAPPAPLSSIFPFCDDLILHYTMDGNAQDTSGNGHNGAVVGASPVAGHDGTPDGALHFNGAGSEVDGPVLALAAPITVSVWMQSDLSPSSMWQTVIGWNDPSDSSGHNGIQLAMNGDTHARLRMGSDSDDIVSNAVVEDGNWHLITGVLDGSVTWLYVDGVLDNTASSSAVLGTNHTFYVGRSFRTPDYGEHFDGSIDEVRVYGRALNAAEVAALAH